MTAETIDEILTAMNAAGMTQRELARRLNISGPRVSQMLRPRCGLRASTIERVYKAIAEYEGPKGRDWPAIAAAQAIKINAMRARNRRLQIKVAKLEEALIKTRLTPPNRRPS